MSDVRLVAGDQAGKRIADIVLVHGLEGDWMSTWHPKGNPDIFWPRWLADDIEGLAIWSLGYDVPWSNWRLGHSSMSVVERAKNLLYNLGERDFGKTPLVFIGHSLGGLIIEQMLNIAVSMNRESWKEIAQQTRGVAFLSTPHLGAVYAGRLRKLRFLRPSVTVDELAYGDSHLLFLDEWIREYVSEKPMDVLAVYETRRTFRWFRIVDQVTGNVRVGGHPAIPVDKDHISISKPNHRDDEVYIHLRGFIRTCLRGDGVKKTRDVAPAVSERGMVQRQGEPYLASSINGPWAASPPPSTRSFRITNLGDGVAFGCRLCTHIPNGAGNGKDTWYATRTPFVVDDEPVVVSVQRVNEDDMGPGKPFEWVRNTLVDQIAQAMHEGQHRALICIDRTGTCFRFVAGSVFPERWSPTDASSPPPWAAVLRQT